MPESADRQLARAYLTVVNQISSTPHIDIVDALPLETELMDIHRRLAALVGPDSEDGADGRCFVFDTAVFGRQAVVVIYDHAADLATSFVMPVE